MLDLKNSFLGTSARSILTSFLKEAITSSGKRTVIVPSFCCEAVYLSGYFAGAEIIFCDVNTTTYSLDSSDLATKISDDTVCIIVPHMFGYFAYTEKLLELYNEYPDIIWIDDACQTYLASPDVNIPDLYNKLDFRLSSFHSSKPLSGNIALLECFTQLSAKQKILANAIKNALYSDDVGRDHEIRRMQASYFSFIVSYRRLGLGPIHPDPQVFNSFHEAYQYVIRPSADCIHEALKSYGLAANDKFISPHLISSFCNHIYDDVFFNLTKPSYNERLWRLPLVCHESFHQEPLSHKLRHHFLNVSNHYYSLESLFLQNGDSMSCSNSSSFSSRILNLWFTDKEQIMQASCIINEYALQA